MQDTTVNGHLTRRHFLRTVAAGAAFWAAGPARVVQAAAAEASPLEATETGKKPH